MDRQNKKVLKKTLVYRTFMLAITWIIMFALTREIPQTTILTLSLEALRFVTYFIFEKGWSRYENSS